MSNRTFRKSHPRPRKECDPGEEEGFLYCLMYYFDEARKESEDTSDKRGRRFRKALDEEEECQVTSKTKKRNDEEDEEMLNPLVYREHIPGRSLRGSLLRRAYTPDRDISSSSSSSASSTSNSRRAHSQPPEVINEQMDFAKYRFRKRRK